MIRFELLSNNFLLLGIYKNSLYHTKIQEFLIHYILHVCLYRTLRIFQSTTPLPHYDNNCLGKTGQNQQSPSTRTHLVL